MHSYGLFDSGVGGLSVLRAMLASQPSLSAVYVADTAWVPYGTKSPDQLKPRINAIAHWLMPRAQQLVVACNTSAALMHGQWPAPVIDPIAATAQFFAGQTAIKRVGVLATPNTVASQAYVRALQQASPGITVSQCACPGLADAVEQGTVAALSAQLTLWLGSLLNPEPLQALVLGCTHYPFAQQAIIQTMQDLGYDIPLFDPAFAMAKQGQQQTTKTLTDLTLADLTPAIELFTTGDPVQLHKQLQQLDLPLALKQLKPQALSLN